MNMLAISACKGPPVPRPDDDVCDDEDIPYTLVIGGQKFLEVKGPGEMVAATDYAGGFYRDKKLLIFTTPEGVDRACLVNNRHTRLEGPFFVLCRRLEDGRRYYMHGVDNQTNAWLGLADMRYSEQHARAKEISQQFGLHPRPASMPKSIDAEDSFF